MSFLFISRCSVFGKTLENVRKHVNITLVHTEASLVKQSAKSSLKRFTIFNQDLVAIEHRKTKLKMNKPVAIGASILDESKILMYEFHYDFIKKLYGSRAQLLLTDTDSLMYHIKTENLYDDISKHRHRFDLSNYPKNHPLFDESNKSVVGLFKDESSGTPIEAFVGARSKMYAIKYECSKNNIMKAKGVARSSVRNQFRFKHYEECLFNNHVKMCNMQCIRSQGHQLQIQSINKQGISCFNDKRYMFGAEHEFSSLAYGHCSIPN